MVEAHLQSLKTMLDHAAPHLDPTMAIECRHFFSGAAAYVDGRIFMSLTPAGVALKLPEPSRTALLDRGATPLKYFPKAPIKKDYVVLPETVVEDTDVLGPLIAESARFSLTFPRPRKRR